MTNGNALDDQRQRLLETALQRSPADLVIRNCRILDVHTGQIFDGGIAVVGNRIARVGNIDAVIGSLTRVVEGNERIAVPGLIDGHIHTYESHLPVAELARGLLSHGVTTIVTDFYGEAVVSGPAAVRASLDEAGASLLNIAFVLPMPALYQDRPFMHTGTIDLESMEEMATWPECLGLNECFAKYLLAGEPELRRLVDVVHAQRGKVCGHGAELDYDEIQAWSAYLGAVDDHETVGGEEALAKLRAGIHVIAREGSGVSDLANILRTIVETGADTRRISFCTDILSPLDLLRRGSIDHCVRLAISTGVPAVEAIRMATLNGAECHRLDGICGSLSPGRRADIVLLKGDIDEFEVDTVVAAGQVAVEGGKLPTRLTSPERPSFAYNTVKVPEIAAEMFAVPGPQGTASVRVRVIGVRDGSLITEELERDLAVRDDQIIPAPDRGILKIAAIERHGKSGKIGLGFIEGFGLNAGAIASTYNPHCQHLLVLGTSDEEMAVAAAECARLGGGFVVVAGGAVRASVPFPLYGLLSEEPIESLVSQIERVTNVLHDLGCELSAPFHSLAFSGLPVTIGRLKISSAGLIDVWAGEQVPLVIE